MPFETRVGLQSLNDFIHNGNGDSFQRQQYDFITDNWLKESYLSPWTDTTQFWSPWLRTTEGLRLDYVFGSVNNVMNPLLAQGSYPPGGTPYYLGSFNNGQLDRVFTSPKGGLVLGPFDNTEYFLNFGEGLRAEDIRGTTKSFCNRRHPIHLYPQRPVSDEDARRGNRLPLQADRGAGHEPQSVLAGLRRGTGVQRRQRHQRVWPSGTTPGLRMDN